MIADCSLTKELACVVLTALLGMPGGVLLFLPLYHPLHDLAGLHSEVTFFMLFTIFLLISWTADRRPNPDARPRPVLPVRNVQRNSSSQKKNVAISKPAAITNYNINMGGTDRMGQNSVIWKTWIFCDFVEVSQWAIRDNMEHRSQDLVCQQTSTQCLHESDRGRSLLLFHLVLHYALFLCLVIFGYPEREVSVGLHERIGPCNETVPMHTAFGTVLTKRRYLCAADYDEAYFDFHCLPGGQPPSDGSYWYTACGTPFQNRVEYVAVISTICVLAFTVFRNLHFHSGANIRKTEGKPKRH
ncbi:hypothetical protein ANN_15145 [Periplaneta americana]|uniref:DUF7802 domain-containing protein n=1 Tax=Periplaneta americana TaxID=6978 RepID=A0ABQ8T0H5_PERAM|nr:hypothetical protein ANN_15145 [Periplaneta americana]